jgi:hydrogenase maturation protease
MAERTRLVIGVGNPFRRDDGIGSAVIQRLTADPDLRGIDLLDGGTDGFALLDDVNAYAHVLIIDAVDMGLPPGEIRVFSPAEAKLTIRTDALSTHGFGLAEVLSLLDTLEIDTDLQILGIQAKDISFGEGMSHEVAAQIEEIIGVVKQICFKPKNSREDTPTAASHPQECGQQENL